MAFIYFIGFLIALNQYGALVGEKGILPMKNFLQGVRFRQAPSIFIFYRSDRFLQMCAGLGVALSLFAFSGMSEKCGLFVSMLVWFVLWALYQSFVNAGGIFYSYGWEIMLLEAGFLAIFLGSADVAPSILTIGLYRWVLFRMMLGAGLIKIRCDSCWRAFTTMTFYYETQPLPGPFSRLFHRLPIFIHKLSVLFTHVVELVVPFFFFWPEKGVALAGTVTILFQVLLLLSGNLSWLNCLTIVLCFSCFSDTYIHLVFPWIRTPFASLSGIHFGLTTALAALIAYLSIKPIKNLLSSRQVMNRNFDPLNLVNTYGAFGSVTRVRREIIIEGTSDLGLSETTNWVPYEFKAKPGSVTRHPPQVTPYHYKIDWQMWFAAMSDYKHHPWFIPFIDRLLEGNAGVAALLRHNPFPEKPPAFIRARLYEYKFAPKRSSGEDFWVRKEIGEYLPPVYLRKKTDPIKNPL